MAYNNRIALGLQDSPTVFSVAGVKRMWKIGQVKKGVCVPRPCTEPERDAQDITARTDQRRLNWSAREDKGGQLRPTATMNSN